MLIQLHAEKQEIVILSDRKKRTAHGIACPEGTPVHCPVSTPDRTRDRTRKYIPPPPTCGQTNKLESLTFRHTMYAWRIERHGSRKKTNPALHLRVLHLLNKSTYYIWSICRYFLKYVSIWSTSTLQFPFSPFVSRPLSHYENKTKKGSQSKTVITGSKQWYNSLTHCVGLKGDDICVQFYSTVSISSWLLCWNTSEIEYNHKDTYRVQNWFVWSGGNSQLLKRIQSLCSETNIAIVLQKVIVVKRTTLLPLSFWWTFISSLSKKFPKTFFFNSTLLSQIFLVKKIKLSAKSLAAFPYHHSSTTEHSLFPESFENPKEVRWDISVEGWGNRDEIPLNTFSGCFFHEKF